MHPCEVIFHLFSYTCIHISPVYCILFIYLFYLFVCIRYTNLDRMYPHQLLAGITEKKRKTVLGGKCDTIVDNHN